MGRGDCQQRRMSDAIDQKQGQIGVAVVSFFIIIILNRVPNFILFYSVLFYFILLFIPRRQRPQALAEQSRRSV